ncbi:hypothetical protein E2C01_087226 [Portunus trituberculatus]|uniref:Uncharacterized protein n=1 Tax=Portunus trituberculatus TaxID=210409 RepID=A0A5B7JII1_PORTR|nr:hypothetical protein [Portunus trituberculatus]
MEGHVTLILATIPPVTPEVAREMSPLTQMFVFPKTHKAVPRRCAAFLPLWPGTVCLGGTQRKPKGQGETDGGPVIYTKVNDAKCGSGIHREGKH